MLLPWGSQGGSDYATAGGVLVSGTFQKNGGTIYGADTSDATMKNQNQTTGNGKVKANGVAIVMKAVANPDPAARFAGQIHKRDNLLHWRRKRKRSV